jgi:hypothetical protein
MEWLFLLVVFVAMFSFLFVDKGEPINKVMGKVIDDPTGKTFKWVIGDGEKPFAVGKSTVYIWLHGGRCRTMQDSFFLDLTSHAENLEKAGKVYRIYTWKELYGNQLGDE